MMSLLRWYLRLNARPRAALVGLWTAAGVGGGLALKEGVAWISKQYSIGTVAIAMAILFVVGAIVFGTTAHIQSLIESIKHDEERTREEELKVRNALLKAYDALASLDIQQLRELTAEAHGDIDPAKALPEPQRIAMKIEATVRALYEFLATEYTHTEDVETRIRFEATFMCKSYRDTFMTVAACANADGTYPPSMKERTSDPQKHEKTVAAQLYRVTRPEVIIIEDTQADANYLELYPRQKERIKSSVVCPVFSARSELVGVLVAHCDQARFFRKEKERFWKALLEPFAKRLALDKLFLDIYADRFDEKARLPF